MKAAIILSVFIGAVAVIAASFKSGRFLKSIITTIFQGISALLCVNVIGLFTGITIALNWYTIGCAGVFGVPSVISILLLDIIFR